MVHTVVNVLGTPVGAKGGGRSAEGMGGRGGGTRERLRRKKQGGGREKRGRYQCSPRWSLGVFTAPQSG